MMIFRLSSHFARVNKIVHFYNPSPMYRCVILRRLSIRSERNERTISDTPGERAMDISDGNDAEAEAGARLRRARNIVLVSEGDAEMAGAPPARPSARADNALPFSASPPTLTRWEHATKRSLGLWLPFRQVQRGSPPILAGLRSRPTFGLEGKRGDRSENPLAASLNVAETKWQERCIIQGGQSEHDGRWSAEKISGEDEGSRRSCLVPLLSLTTEL